MSRPVVIVGWWPQRTSAELSAMYCGDGLGWTARDLIGLTDVPRGPASNYPRLSRYDPYCRRNKPALSPLGDSLVDF
jgi:hypothetical protein